MWQKCKLHYLPVLLLVFLSGCSTFGNSRFYGTSFDQSEVTAPAQLPPLNNRIVVIYNHGSLSEDKTDPCFPGSSLMPGGMPKVIKRLAGLEVSGKTIVVYALCTRIPGRLKILHTQDNLKIRLRAKEIISEVKRIRQKGVPGENIFLAGHSAGGWASLLIERTYPDLVNAVIAYSPAFSGVKHRRNRKWQRFRDEQQSYLQEAESLDALVYAFQGDPYNSIADLEFLSEIPGVEFKSYPGSENPSDKSCYRGHRVVFRSCFSEQHADDAVRFIKEKISDKTH